MREDIALVCRLEAFCNLSVVAKRHNPSRWKVCCEQILRPVDTFPCLYFPSSTAYRVDIRFLKYTSFGVSLPREFAEQAVYLSLTATRACRRR